MTFRTKFLLFVSICVPPSNPITACGATSFPGYHAFPKWAIECTLNSTVTEDEEIIFWVDKEQHQQEKRAVLNEALAHISDGRVCPIASTLNSDWESISSTQKAYYLRKVGQVLTEVLTTIAPDQLEKVLEALRCSLDTALVKKGNESRG